MLQAAGKRPFGVSSLTVYIDGTERKTSALKYPAFTEPFVYCKVIMTMMMISDDDDIDSDDDSDNDYNRLERS